MEHACKTIGLQRRGFSLPACRQDGEQYGLVRQSQDGGDSHPDEEHQESRLAVQGTSEKPLGKTLNQAQNGDAPHLEIIPL